MNYSGAESAIGLVKQTTYGTAIAESVARTVMNVKAVPFEHDVKRFDIPGMFRTRQKVASNAYHTTDGQVPSIELSGDFNRHTGKLLLAAFYQNGTESGSAPNAMDVSFPVAGAAQQPDFTTNAGVFFDVTRRLITGANSHRFIDCICTKLGFSIKANEYLQFNAMMVGRGSVIVNANPSVAWPQSAVTLFHHLKAARVRINFGSGYQDMALRDWSIDQEREMVPVGQNGSGSFQQPALIATSGTFKLVNSFNPTQYALAKTASDTGAVVTINIEWGNAAPGTVNGDLSILCTGQIEKCSAPGEGLLEMSFEGKLCASDETASQSRIILADNVDLGLL